MCSCFVFWLFSLVVAIGHDQVVGGAGARRMDDEARRKCQIVEAKVVYLERKYAVLL
jgi:hypothetical protein